MLEHILYSILLFVEVDTPEGVDYRLEDGEIGAGELEDYEQLSEQEEQDGEYDPLIAGSVEVALLCLIVIIFCDC